MNIILMQHNTDCEVAALATACQVSYDEAKAALNWKDLPGPIENPVYGNPFNLYRALIKLGFWKRNITLTQLLTGQAPAGTVVLLKANLLAQHWVVYAGSSGDYLSFWWGNSATEPKFLTKATVSKWFTAAGPVNDAFVVYKASIWRIMFERIKRWFK